MPKANIVRQSFNRAASTYTASAALQQGVRNQLLRQATRELNPSDATTILDAGCGTGDLLQQLRLEFPRARMIGLDFAEGMLRQQRPVHGAYLINADLEHLPIANGGVDIYLSSLAWQWCDISRAVSEAARVLRPGGQLWVTTLVSGTFTELANALNMVSLQSTHHLLTLPDPADVLAQFGRTALQLVHSQRDALTTWHDDFVGLRRSIRGVGANRVPAVAREAIDRNTRQSLINAYEQQRTALGLPLTYNVLTIHAQRT